MDVTTEPVVCRPEQSDLPRLVELFENDLEDLRLPSDRDALLTSAQRLLDQPETTGWFRVARLTPGGVADGVIVAHAWESVKFAGPAFWIETLYVAPALRRRGMGRRMVVDLVDHARANGFAGIDLEAYRMNAPASYLYRALGFRRIGRERYSFRLS
ncbi:MAG: ribosomal protein S18 acetylase RimI-like enzyme [Myxococcota bacterium]